MKQDTSGILVSETRESSTVILSFKEQSQEEPVSLNATVSIELEDIKVRENKNLKCVK